MKKQHSYYTKYFKPVKRKNEENNTGNYQRNGQGKNK